MPNLMTFKTGSKRGLRFHRGRDNRSIPGNPSNSHFHPSRFTTNRNSRSAEVRSALICVINRSRVSFNKASGTGSSCHVCKLIAHWTIMVRQKDHEGPPDVLGDNLVLERVRECRRDRADAGGRAPRTTCRDTNRAVKRHASWRTGRTPEWLLASGFDLSSDVAS